MFKKGGESDRERESRQMDSQTDPSRQIDEQRMRQGPGELMSNQLFVISNDPPRKRLISVTGQVESGITSSMRLALAGICMLTAAISCSIPFN